MVMAVPCCMSWSPESTLPPRPHVLRVDGIEKPTLWPLASTAWMDYTAAKGAANAFHFRGPFLTEAEPEWSAIGGAYLTPGGEWNPAYWQKERDLVWHAYQMGSYVEKVVIDTWGCKYSQAGNPYMPWSKEAIDACGRTWHPEHERYARKVVEELGCFGNIIWALDNEGENIQGWQVAWFRRLGVVIRDEEQQSGCGFVHLIGTGVKAIQAQVDYAITHDRAPLTVPLADRWTLNNEHNPEFAPEFEARYFADARKVGLAWALWRAGASDEDYAKTLGLVKQIVEGGEPPVPPPVCTLGTPTAREALAAGMNPTINVQRTVAGAEEITAGKWISGTPLATFGVNYCREAGWTDGRSRCAVAGEGHPERLACEAHFLEAPCPMFSMDHCAGTGEQCPITWDPYIVIGGVNQFHPENVRAGCRESLMVRDPAGNMIRGEWWKATAHGKGYLKACNFDGSVCGVSDFEVDQ